MCIRDRAVSVTAAEGCGQFQYHCVDGHGPCCCQQHPEVAQKPSLILVGGHQAVHGGIRHVDSGIENGGNQIISQKHIGKLCFSHRCV